MVDSVISLDRDPQPPAWHPKISPYRLIVLSTNIGLGTAKAVMTQRGRSLAPITLEWLLGTLIFLLLFSVSSYDSRECASPFLSWLFKPDCMSLVWQLLASFSLQRPSYVSEEKSPREYAGAVTPIVTPFRLLLSFMVVSFGVSKALLGYSGLSTALTWTDWALAVPITTILYIMGLYENNSLDLWSSFFWADQSGVFYSASICIAYAAGISILSAYTLGLCYAMWVISQEPDSAGWLIPRPEGYKVTFRTQLDDWSSFGWRLSILELLFLNCVLGGWPLFLFLALVVSGLVRGMLRIVRRPILHLVRMTVPSLAGGSQHRMPLYHSSSRDHHGLALSESQKNSICSVLFRVSLHLLVIVGSLAFALMSSGLTVACYDVVSDKELHPVTCISFAICLIILGSATLGFVLTALAAALSMVAPAFALVWRVVLNYNLIVPQSSVVIENI